MSRMMCGFDIPCLTVISWLAVSQHILIGNFLRAGIAVRQEDREASAERVLEYFKTSDRQSVAD